MKEPTTARRSGENRNPTNVCCRYIRFSSLQCVAATALMAVAVLLAVPSHWITFEDVGSEAGFGSEIVYGGVERQKYILETSGTGVAIFDYDRDGRPDVFLVNGSRLDLPEEQAPSNRLYRNLGDWKFEDVTEDAGLGRSGWGQAACVGDFDNDGWTDLNVTSFGGNNLYQNRGDGTFADVSKKAGVQTAGRWSAGCTFLDVDKDGHLDLFIAAYVDHDDATRFKPGSGPNCKWRDMPVMCGPMGLKASQNILYRGNGDGTFTDVSTASGITGTEGFYCFMPATLDFDGDGWTDIYVACDSTPNILYRNNGDGTFTDVAMESGAAYNENGQEQAGMGVGIGDYDRDGRLDVLVTNFSEDTPTLYRNIGDGEFTDETFSAKLGYKTQYLSWGVGLVDFDNDGWKDIFIASGHVYPEVDRHPSATTYHQAKQVYRNRGNGTFEDLSARTGAAIAAKKASRGAAFEDLDGDGDLDIVVANLNDLPSVLRNDGGERNNWLMLRLEGAESNRSAIGARIEVTAGGLTQTDEVRSASSFYSTNGLRVHFGLGTETEAESVEVHWPSGAHQKFKKVSGNRVILIQEKEGIVSDPSE